MSALSFFAPRSLPPDLAAKTRSLTCLSLLCFALADVRDGLGPFLGIFLQSHGWAPWPTPPAASACCWPWHRWASWPPWP